jgi:hypothetical protein
VVAKRQKLKWYSNQQLISMESMTHRKIPSFKKMLQTAPARVKTSLLERYVWMEGCSSILTRLNFPLMLEALAMIVVGVLERSK